MDTRDEIIYKLLGQRVHVEVDRPMGYLHGDIPYTLNYGYIPHILAPDGEEQDAYILGIDHPLDRFTGTVIAVIHRLDDVEDKWVVTPEGSNFTKDQIRSAVHFQEQYFDTVIWSI